jgi:GTP-binding protein
VTLPIIAIVGRPNVGKSSLFNRMIRQKLAVVDRQSGVTRDRNFSPCEWRGQDFYLVDTGGMVPGSDDRMEQLILEQARIATEEADILLFVVDCQTGVTDIDTRIAHQLLRTDKPLIIGVNKADNERLDLEANTFYSLGIEKLVAVSAANGRGMGDLLDAMVDRLPEVPVEEPSEGTIRVAVVGRPNVGKSSFVNFLLGENRHIVSDVPGTTRDSIDSPVIINDRNYTLIDTAGLRRRSKVKESIEYFTTLRTVRAIQRCDIAVILLDANEGMNFQELKIIDEVSQSRRGMVLAINKWDIFDKDENSAAIYARQIKEAAPTHNFIPTIFISALKGTRVVKTLSLVDKVYDEYTRRIPTSELNEFLEGAVKRQPPAAAQGKWIKLYYITQPETTPPRFVIFCNYPKLIQEAYRRYLTNRLRERFGFEGIPLDIKIKARDKKK